jgi:hypothetical protein
MVFLAVPVTAMIIDLIKVGEQAKEELGINNEKTSLRGTK